MNHNLEPLDVLDQRAERCMQACRVGCHSVESANDLLAECYGLIGALKAWKDAASVMLKRDMQRIREMEARGNALCPHCNQPHFTLLADKTCLLCDEKARADAAEDERDRLREAIERHRETAEQYKAIPGGTVYDRKLWDALEGRGDGQ